MSGQVNRGTYFGDQVYKLSLNKMLRNYVEVGTWNGQGSTKCFMDGILTRSDGACLYSLEANIEFYKEAKKYWDPILEGAESFFPQLHLLYGRIIETEDLVSIEEIEAHQIFSQHPWLEWRARNISEYNSCDNVLSTLPEEIDVLFLDGGQFSTRAEFDLLKDRTKIVLLDDTATYKTEKIREEILAVPNVWSVIFDDNHDRHGVFMACRTEFIDLLRG